MAGRIEREFKLRIPDEAAWQALLARLEGPIAAPVLQVNHFFDTPALALRRARIALRLREEQGRFTLALKGPLLASEPALAVRPEEELELDASRTRALLAGQGSPLEAFRTSALAGTELVQRALGFAGHAPLRRLGAFENERTRVGPLAFPPGSDGPPLVFELDRTRFPDGGVDLELELELPDGARTEEVERALLALLSGLAIPTEPMPSKAARFFRTLDRPGRGE